MIATLAFVGSVLSQAPASPPAALDWSSDDSVRIAYATAHGNALRRRHAVIWAPPDSLDQRWLAAFADSLDRGLAHMIGLMGGPYPWQRMNDRPVQFYLSPGRFISHAGGQDVVFIALSLVRQGRAPYLHEAAHELLSIHGPFYPFEQGDSAAEAAAAARFPYWLSEGLPDVLAQTAAAATGFREGDVFAIGGLAKSDSVCAARLAASPRRAEIVEKVGSVGPLDALFTTDRPQVAPVFYACAQAFTGYLARRVGLATVVGVFPDIPTGTWLSRLERVAGQSLPALRRTWLTSIGAP